MGSQRVRHNLAIKPSPPPPSLIKAHSLWYLENRVIACLDPEIFVQVTLGTCAWIPAVGMEGEEWVATTELI